MEILSVTEISKTSFIMIEFGIIILISTIIGLFAAALKQPMIPVYILVGLLMNYLSSMNLIPHSETIASLSELGIAFLLFLIGMELNLERIKEIMGLVVFGTTVQVALTSLFIFSIMSVFSIPWKEALIASFAMSFSSTAIVIKFLSDKGIIDTVFGRNALGILLMQDIFVVLAIPLIAPNISTPFMYHFLDVMIKGAGMLALAIVANRVLIKPLFKKFYNNVEISFLLSLSFLFIFSALSTIFGFSIAIGGFLGGLAVATYPYSYRVLSRISHLRDFFMVLFFVSLGFQISLGTLTEKYIFMGILIALFTLLIKPFIYIFISLIFGFDAKNSLQLGIGMAQTSEFSLILGSLALSQLVIGNDIFSLIALVFFITSFVSSYLLQWGNLISNRFFKYFEPFEKFRLFNREELEADIRVKESKKLRRNHIIIYGINAMTKTLLKKIDQEKVVVLDNEYNQVKILRRLGYEVVFGNANDEEILRYVHTDKASLFVYLKDNFDEMVELLTTLRSINRTIIIVGKAKTYHEALKLYEGGIDFVLIDGVHNYKDLNDILDYILNNDKDKIENIKSKEIENLSKEIEKEVLALNLPKELQTIKDVVSK